MNSLTPSPSYSSKKQKRKRKKKRLGGDCFRFAEKQNPPRPVSAFGIFDTINAFYLRVFSSTCSKTHLSGMFSFLQIALIMGLQTLKPTRSARAGVEPPGPGPAAWLGPCAELRAWHRVPGGPASRRSRSPASRTRRGQRGDPGAGAHRARDLGGGKWGARDAEPGGAANVCRLRRGQNSLLFFTSSASSKFTPRGSPAGVTRNLRGPRAGPLRLASAARFARPRGEPSPRTHPAGRAGPGRGQTRRVRGAAPLSPALVAARGPAHARMGRRGMPSARRPTPSPPSPRGAGTPRARRSWWPPAPRTHATRPGPTCSGRAGRRRRHLPEGHLLPAPGRCGRRGSRGPGRTRARGGAAPPPGPRGPGLTVSAENFCAGAGGSSAASSQQSWGSSMLTGAGTARGRRGSRPRRARAALGRSSGRTLRAGRAAGWPAEGRSRSFPHRSGRPDSTSCPRSTRRSSASFAASLAPVK